MHESHLSQRDFNYDGCIATTSSRPIYRKVSNIRRILVGNKVVDH